MSAARATAMATAAKRVLAKGIHREQDDDDHRCRANGERDEREHQVERQEGSRVAHPLALSKRTTVKGAAPRGLMSKVRPQWPTMTSAGADRPYRPGAISGKW